MKPENLKTKIFLDGSDIEQTNYLLSALGFLDGQTTNPTNFATSPEVKTRLDAGYKFGKDEVYEVYKKRVQQLSGLLPNGSVSIEVYADEKTTAEQMFEQGKEMFSWIKNAHIKFPTTKEGLRAAEMSIAEEMRVNMTLVFSQKQAAAVYAATKGAKRGDVFISPFIGRLIEKGENGFQLVENIIKMYQQGDGHVEVLSASVRNAEQFTRAIQIGSDIITAYFDAIKNWHEQGMGQFLPVTPDDSTLAPIPYQELNLNAAWSSFDIRHPMTDSGMERFATDWKNIIE